MGTMDVALDMVAMNTPVIAICYAGLNQAEIRDAKGVLQLHFKRLSGSAAGSHSATKA